MPNAETIPASASPFLRILPMREGHLLFELAGLDETLALHAAMEAPPVEGILEIVPAARTLMVAFNPLVLSADTLIDIVQSRLSADPLQQPGEIIDIPVLYDGEDLDDVSALLSMSPEKIVALHTASDFKVAFTGFAPGFAYLSGIDAALTVPRRKSPRTHVPAGSVAIAGEFSGVYPKASPGGWQLIGRTPVAMFDLNRSPASLLQPGYRVKFRAISAREFEDIQRSHQPVPPSVVNEPASPYLRVRSAPLPLLLQDLGRKGKAQLGVSVSGAADRLSLKRANRIVGNLANAPALEIPMTGASFASAGESVIAVCGAAIEIEITSATGEQLSVPPGRATALNDGDLINIAPSKQGMRSYLAVRGGFEAPMVIDSVARDTLAEIGPMPLKAGDNLAIRPANNTFVIAEDDGVSGYLPKAGDTVTLDVVMGPRTDWFTIEAVQSFLSQDWLVTPQASRVGIRLEGQALTRAIDGELPSEATLHGAIQVPASGQPVLFLVDHPLTGGYPVIANVAGHHLDLAAQIPPGARIRFNALDGFRELPLPAKIISERPQ